MGETEGLLSAGSLGGYEETAVDDGDEAVYEWEGWVIFQSRRGLYLRLIDFGGGVTVGGKPDFCCNWCRIPLENARA